MKKLTLLLLFCSQFLFAQIEKRKILPTSVAVVQYAGSIGWLSAGYFRQSFNEKIELGLLYGNTPESKGGEIHALVFKIIYEPLQINLNEKFQIEPIQAGVFIVQNFSNNLHMKWPDKYDKGYYWWTNSMRFHVFLGAQAGYVLDNPVIRKISLYFEVNTNDLYLASYVSNNNANTLGIDEIFFFGTGLKIYFQNKN